MTIASAFTTALAQAQVSVDLWLEIEGLPCAFGFVGRAASFFAGRAVQYRRLAMRPTLADIPSSVSQEIRPLDGDSSIGEMTIRLSDDAPPGLTLPVATIVDLIGGVGRTDKQLFVGVGRIWAPTTAYSAVGVGAVVKPTTAGTGTNKTSFFRCTTGGTSGGTEPVWTGATVADGSVVWTTIDLRSRLFGDVGYLCYAGTAADADYPLTDGVAYVGREAFSYTAKNVATNGGGGYFSGVTRWIYQLGSNIAQTSSSEGAIIAPYPRSLARRRAILYTTADGTDAGKVARWSGTIKTYKLNQQTLELELTLETIESEYKVTGFSTQRRAKLDCGMYGLPSINDPSGPGEFTPNSGESIPDPLGFTYLADTAASQWTNGEYVYLRVEDEYLLAKINIGPYNEVQIIYDPSRYTSATNAARGLFGSKAVQHHAGADVIECMIIAKQDSSGQPEFRYSKFSSDHPLDVVRTLLESGSGTGLNEIDAWGAAINVARIDTVGIAALKANWMPNARWLEIIEEPFDVKEKISQILKPFGCYTVQLLDNLLTIKRLNPPIPGLTVVKTITNAEIANIGGWSGNVEEVVGKVIFRCNWDATAGKFFQVYTENIRGARIEAQEFYDRIYKTLVVEAKGQWTEDRWGAQITFGSGQHTAAFDTAKAYIDLILDRYAKPSPILVVEVDYSHLTVEVGDLVYLTEANIPNIATGSRGLSNVVFEVRSKAIDDQAGKVFLSLFQTYYSDQYRLIAPAATVNNYTAGPPAVLTLNAHDYTQASDGVDASYFDVTDTIEVLSSDLYTSRGTGTITVVSGNNITLSAALASAPSVGDILIHRNYDNATTARRAKSAFLAGNANPPTLGPSTLALPHQYAS